MKRTLLVALAALFILSLMSAAAAAEKSYSPEFSVSGRVVSADFLTRTLSIRWTEPPLTSAEGKATDITFTMGGTTRVRMCNEDKRFEDIRIGEKVEVKYHEREGKLFADRIDLPTPLIACYLE
jgi:hypothetical protein